MTKQVKTQDLTPPKHPFVVTHSGKAVEFPRPSTASICIEDIATSLSRINRYLGATPEPYCVAQHCVAGAKGLLINERKPKLALHFLLHDAHEAYLGDIPRPVVKALNTAVSLEGKSTKTVTNVFEDALFNIKESLQISIYASLNLPMPTAAEMAIVTQWDNAMLGMERRVFFENNLHWGANVEEAQTVPVSGRDINKVWKADCAASEFIRHFNMLKTGFNGEKK